MIFDFLRSLKCIRQDEISDYFDILNSWAEKKPYVAFMPAIHWYSGTYNLFDQKAEACVQNMIWVIPAGQRRFFWLPGLRNNIEAFYKDDEIDIINRSEFPGIDVEEFEECILLNSDSIQRTPENTVLGANIILVRLSLSSGRDTILLILLDHQDNCWKNIIEKYNVNLTWFVDSGRGTDNYFVYENLYKLMKNTSHRELLPKLYFKGLYNKGEIPEGFSFLYSMLSHPDEEGYDEWRYFSGVYKTFW